MDKKLISLEIPETLRKDLKKEALDKETQEKWYANNDMHRLYFAKIVAAYK